MAEEVTLLFPRRSFPVVWQEHGGDAAVGKLEIADTRVTLRGRTHRDRAEREFDRAEMRGLVLSQGELAATATRPTLHLRLHGGWIRIAGVGAGIVFEIADALSRVQGL